MGSPTTETEIIDSQPLTQASGSAIPSDIQQAKRAAITATHLKTLEELVGGLNTTTQNLLAKERQYDQVYTLVTYWSDKVSDRPYLEEYATDLWQVFKDTFNFDVGKEPFKIPAENPRRAFNKAFQEALERAESEEGQTSLLIVYYGGHASAEEGFSGNITWDSDIKGTEKIYWSAHQSQLEETNCDLLFLFDCCYAGAMINPNWNFPRRCELLGSSYPNVKTVGTKEDSFTRVLISVLKEEYKNNGNCDINILNSILCDTRRYKSLPTEP